LPKKKERLPRWRNLHKESQKGWAGQKSLDGRPSRLGTQEGVVERAKKGMKLKGKSGAGPQMP
jgi:hypothetical protein